MELQEIKNLISEREEFINSYNKELKTKNNNIVAKVIEYFVANSKVQIGTILKIHKETLRYSRNEYYKVTRFEATPGGFVNIIGVKRKINKEFGVREVYLYVTKIDNITIDEQYSLIKNYNEDTM